MNRYDYSKEEKQPSAVKPKFIPVAFDPGDKVINIETIWMVDGYYEAGCEFMFRAVCSDEKFLVYPLVDDDLLPGGISYKISNLCFKIVEKDWMRRRYPTNE